MKIEKVKKKINFFELTPKISKGHSLLDLNQVFSFLETISKSKSKNRFFSNGEKKLYVTDIKREEFRNQISGRILNIRMDEFPELLNTTDDKIRDIEASDTEGIIEASHFVLFHYKNRLILSLEFNQYGPRSSDFVFVVEKVMIDKKIGSKIEFEPLVKDDLPNHRKRINRISSIYGKVHKDNINRISNIDIDLFDAFNTAQRYADSEYVVLEFKYDYRHSLTQNNIWSKVMRIINSLIENKTSYHVFSALKVRAEDSFSNNKVKDFDLLNIWIKAEVEVEKKPKSRVVVSGDILDKIKQNILIEFV